jgi:hypothetical protein
MHNFKQFSIEYSSIKQESVCLIILLNNSAYPAKKSLVITELLSKATPFAIKRYLSLWPGLEPIPH